MNHCDYLMDHDRDLFESLCWIYYPIIKAVRAQRTEQRIQIGEFTAGRCGYNTDDWHIGHSGLSTITGYVRFKTNAMDMSVLDFHLNLPITFTKLSGRTVTTRVPQYNIEEAFQIVDHRFTYNRTFSCFPQVVSHMAERDKVFFKWMDEIRHLSILAKVSL